MITKIKKALHKFIEIESSSSITLGMATIVALLLANSKHSEIYHSILHMNFFNLSVSHWINDGLMAIFFFLVGLEIKKEITVGELNSFKKASLPVAAAIGGMTVPALIFIFFNSKHPEINGWGIPMATDIAFALGVLSLFRNRIPPALKILLLAVAIVDDLGAIIVIAIFYTSQFNILGFVISIVSILAILLIKRASITNYLIYIFWGIILWFGILYSGIHATIAGVIVGLLTPITFKNKKFEQIEPVNELIKILHIPVSFVIMPIFALANAGVEFNFSSIALAAPTGLFKGILLGLVIGKPLGIFLFSFFSYKLKISSLPKELNWRHICVLGSIAGIGFTMSLFISKLALPRDLEHIAKLAIIVASLFATLMGAISTLLISTKSKKQLD